MSVSFMIELTKNHCLSIRGKTCGIVVLIMFKHASVVL